MSKIEKIICDICKKEINESSERWMTVKGSKCTSRIRPAYEVHEKCFLKVFGEPAEKDTPKNSTFVKCSAYHVMQHSPVDEDPRYECWGTMERDECTCDGNKLKCNFYKYNPKTDELE